MAENQKSAEEMETGVIIHGKPKRAAIFREVYPINRTLCVRGYSERS